jgi:hypothetical protein
MHELLKMPKIKRAGPNHDQSQHPCPLPPREKQSVVTATKRNTATPPPKKKKVAPPQQSLDSCSPTSELPSAAAVPAPAAPHEILTPDMFSTGLIRPTQHDVLCGRGNSINMHVGNKLFRAMIMSLKIDYLLAPKPLKALFPSKIISQIKELDPPGRFLKFDMSTREWSEIDIKQAIAKTRQALREGAPSYIGENIENSHGDVKERIGNEEGRSNENGKDLPVVNRKRRWGKGTIDAGKEISKVVSFIIDLWPLEEVSFLFSSVLVRHQKYLPISRW